MRGDRRASRRRLALWRWVMVAAVALGAWACGNDPMVSGRDAGGLTPDGPLAAQTGGGQGGGGDATGSVTDAGGLGGAGGTSPGAAGCSDLFRQDVVQAFSLEVSPDEWSKIVLEFQNVAALQTGTDFAVYHPAILHFGSETVTNAAIKLHGQSSWYQAATLDGDRAKMQFNVSFDQFDPNGAFHGLSKLTFDMPRSDWTFLHNRLAQAWMRDSGILAPCSASAQLAINGSYYGLYVLEENVGHRLLQEFFPSDPDGDLWKGGSAPETSMPNFDRRRAFKAAADLASLSAIVDIASSVRTWAAEALLNDADGYYGGNHNFYIYDQIAIGKGYVFLSQDTDSTLDWLAEFDNVVSNDHPIFWWAARAAPAPPPGPDWMIVMNDPPSRALYTAAIADLLDKWDVGLMQSRLDAWSAQVAPLVATDPHAWATIDDFHHAVSLARGVISDRPAYLRSFVACERDRQGDDADKDGFLWCDDCDDRNPSANPGAPELCGNGVDDNCNGFVDEGCPPP